ncbi:MAG: CBS domain-containing protein, partial [Alphaproteobacteria bacterium]
PRWATKISGRMGEAFGTGLIVLGVLNILVGNFVGGMWWFLIGMFVRAAASSSYYQVLTRRVFEGEPVRRFMTPDPVTVRPGATLEELVEDYIYGYHHQLFPVMEDGRLIGCVGTPQVKAVPRDQWDVRTVGQVLAPCSGENTIDPETDAVKALGLMRRGGQSRLLVARDGQLLGIVTLRDMLDLLSLKMDLEGLE